MQNEDLEKKSAPVRASKKSEGWREREEAKAAGVTPRKIASPGSNALRRSIDRGDHDSTLVRC